MLVDGRSVWESIEKVRSGGSDGVEGGGKYREERSEYRKDL